MSHFQDWFKDKERWKVDKTDNSALRLSWKHWVWSNGQYSKGHLWRNKSDWSWQTQKSVVCLIKLRSFNWTKGFENIAYILTSYRLRKLYISLVCISVLGVHLLIFSLCLNNIW